MSTIEEAVRRRHPISNALEYGAHGTDSDEERMRADPPASHAQVERHVPVAFLQSDHVRLYLTWGSAAGWGGARQWADSAAKEGSDVERALVKRPRSWRKRPAAGLAPEPMNLSDRAAPTAWCPWSLSPQ